MKFSEYVEKNGRDNVVSAGEHIFYQGDKDRFIYIVQSGLLKAYYTSNDGKENIKSFIMPGGQIGSLAANHAGEPSTFSLMTLSQSKLFAVNFAELYKASQTDPELASEIVNFLLDLGIRKELREFELLCLSAEDRYRRLLEQAPELWDLVTQNEIARYLGVTPVGLSRIKKRIG